MLRGEMRVVVRVDASHRIGLGHVVRCLTLANALRERDASVSFVCREHEGHLCGLIEEKGFPVCRLPLSSKTGIQAGNTLAHAAWLGAHWQEDAEQTRAAIDAAPVKPDWLVVDHYALDESWESTLRASVGRIMVIDDLADRAHDCDLLLDQNMVAQMETRYAGKVPVTCGLLLGPEYALLQPIYAELHNRVPAREGPIRRIFIFFGGADSTNLTDRSLAAFLQLNQNDIDVDVVITADSPHAKIIHEQTASHSNIHIHSNLPTLASLIAKADLAIGGGGVTSWERLCLGLPSLVVSVAENQRPIVEELNRHGLIRWLGHHDTVDQGEIAQQLNKLIHQGLDGAWSRRCLAAVDGKGTKRVCAALTVTATTPLRVRAAKAEDEALLLAWANDPVTRRNGFYPDTIPATTHKTWFRNRLRNREGCRIYMVETIEGVAVGQVRFESRNEGWEVHYALGPVFRARGLGRLLLEEALLKLRAETNCSSIFGRVKDDNRSSQRIFEALGFKALPKEESGVTMYRLVFDAVERSMRGPTGLCR